MPQMITVAPDGRFDSSGKSFWFIPGKFGFCPCCLDQPHPSMRERTKLAGLSGEGRSSATTLLVSTALEWMNGSNSGVPKEKRKLLGFTDNRQDAALQAGHFNDFLFVSLLRGAILRAVLDAGDDGMAEDEFGLRVVKALGFTAGNKDALSIGCWIPRRAPLSAKMRNAPLQRFSRIGSGLICGGVGATQIRAYRFSSSSMLSSSGLMTLPRIQSASQRSSRIWGHSTCPRARRC